MKTWVSGGAEFNWLQPCILASLSWKQQVGPGQRDLGGELRARKLIFQFGHEVQARLSLALGLPSVCSGHPAPYGGDGGSSGHDQAVAGNGVPWGQISSGGLSWTSWICSSLG